MASVLMDLSKDRILAVMSLHRGSSRGVPMGELVYEATGLAPTPALERRARMLISALRDEGYPICATPRQGYYYANCEAELHQCCAFLRERAMHSLKLEAKLRRMALPDLLGQLRFNQ